VCRSIKVLRNSEPPATPGDISAAALQFVRKISGCRKPSKANQEAFDRAVAEISAASERLLETMSATKSKSAGAVEAPALSSN
jgi:hypothetical protein